MKQRTFNLRLQLIIGFLLVILFVIGFALSSSLQTRRLYERAETLYYHPLQVKEATDNITIDVLTSRVAIRDYIISDDENNRQTARDTVSLALLDIEKQFDVLYELYLGPISDVDEAYATYQRLKLTTETRLAADSTGNMNGVIESLGDHGDLGLLRMQLDSDVKRIDDFANNKANELNIENQDFYQLLVINGNVLITVILILSGLISVYLIQAIRKPLKEISQEIGDFREGKLSARSKYNRRNEFGELAASFNSMADTIQRNLELNTVAENISDAMQRYEEQDVFFRTMLTELMKAFNANTAAVYLLNEAGEAYDCFDSIGLPGQIKKSFDASALEGEFGLALATRETQYICRLQDDTQHRFPTSSGELTPREIMTIPIVTGDKVIAVISLTSIDHFHEHAGVLIERIVPTLTARTEGTLAFQTIRDILNRLEHQNRELDAQKNELSLQADELMRQNTELDMQSSQLAEASKLKTTFLSNMSHELRTPLNSIIALSGVLSRRLSAQIPEEELSYLEIVERNGRNLLSLINDILDISRIEAGREEIELTSFDLRALVTDLTEMLKPIAVEKQIALDWHAPDEAVSIVSDERKCRHILQNIIGNAIKFTEQGSVRVEARPDGDFVRIVVKDTGIGISKENIGRVFSEFQQADGSTSRKFGGSGLGLAIAKKYAELLGGNISVESTLGEGSTFTISLPLTYQNESIQLHAPYKPVGQKPPAKPMPIAGSGAGEKTLLIIEDSEPAIIQIKDLFERSGYSILVAHSAQEAYRLIEKTVPNGIILDLMMPEIDGFETLISLRESEQTAHIPVLILTAKHITKDDLSRLKRNHIFQIIQKGGINGEELLAAVSGMLADSVAPSIETESGNIPARETATGTENIPGWEKPLVLVIEDNEDNRTTVRALLTEDFHVIEASDGEEGIALAKSKMPDLILMDIALPGINGIEAFHTIRNGATTCHIPIIALTASAMVQERSRILAHGFEAFVAKPIQVGELSQAIKEVLYGR